VVVEIDKVEEKFDRKIENLTDKFDKMVEKVGEKLDSFVDKVQESFVEQKSLSVTLKSHIQEHCKLKDIENTLKEHEEGRVEDLDKKLDSVSGDMDKLKFVAKYVITPVLTTLLVGVTKLLFF
jgi:hypothetical protein